MSAVAEAVAKLARLEPHERDARLDDQAIEALLSPLGSERRSEQRLAADAISPLVGSTPRIAAALRAALASPRQRLRWGAAYTLGQSGDMTPAMWPAVVEALARDDGDQRWAAAELACKLARTSGEVLASLREAVAAESPLLRKMALYCLRDLMDAALTRLARNALGDRDPGVRLAALSAITRVPESDSLRVELAEEVAALLARDANPGVRRAAAVALGKLAAASTAVLAALSRAERDSDPSLARAAAAARKRLAG